MKITLVKAGVLVSLIAWGIAAYGGVTKATNIGGIINTRHNLTQSFLGGTAVIMDPFRNNYGEVCVYCHTPHGANTSVALPLWNRTIKSTTYKTYDQLGTNITQPVSQPGPNSLSCLSCHDGTVAIDSIINMPGSGKANPAQATTQNDAFLNTWTTNGGPAPIHATMGGGSTTTCITCHNIPGSEPAIPDWGVAFIGTDLTNDHPVGIRFPAAGPGVDFNQPNRNTGRIAYFDTDGNGHADANNIRVYASGNDFSVECASCHDPHGVPSGGQGTVNFPTFLRTSNTGSALCLTCHVK